MSSEMYARIQKNPKFKELVSKRERLAWTLTGIVLVLFFGLFMTVAFYPSVLAIRLGDGYVTTDAAGAKVGQTVVVEVLRDGKVNQFISN